MGVARGTIGRDLARLRSQAGSMSRRIHRPGVGADRTSRRSRDAGDDAGLDQVLELAGLRVEAEVIAVVLQRLAGGHGAIFAGVLGNLAQRGLDRLADDLDPEALVVVVGLRLAQDRRSPRQGNTDTRNDAFLDRRARGQVLAFIPKRGGLLLVPAQGEPAGVRGVQTRQAIGIVPARF